MAVLKRRSRIVSFRLSPEEYEAMKERCIMEGARSISDFARASACRSLTTRESFQKGLVSEATIHLLRARVDELEREVRRLIQFMDAPQPTNHVRPVVEE